MQKNRNTENRWFNVPKSSKGVFFFNQKWYEIHTENFISKKLEIEQLLLHKKTRIHLMKCGYYVPACHDPGWPGPGRCIGQVTVLLASWVPRTVIGNVIINHQFNILLLAFHVKQIHNLSDGQINNPFIREDIVYVL